MNANEKIQQLKRQVDDSVLLRHAAFEAIGSRLIETAHQISGVIGAGGKVIFVGNGSLAAIADLVTTEFIARMSSERQRQALPVMTLGSDAALITGIGDDYGFENIYARQIEGLGHKGDLLFVLSITGNSANLVRAVQVARDRGLLTTALIGNQTGRLVSLVDRVLLIQHPLRQRLEEEYLFLLHLLVDIVERDLLT
jgi:D-sedoheptulose 7-phosphate isomerase